ncbi:MAG: glycoside hydrolase [Planctomycetes bacterium B3_Pla]|nr:MAG: glycoside hydrolase [Planctomycetes bacterium B3_Pla]
MKMKRHSVLVSLACFFGVVGMAFGAEASGELGPEAIEVRIRQHRMGELIVRAKPGAAVRVEQLRHEFWFGAALSSGAFSGRLSAEDQRRYEQTFLANFNAAVTENALKWHDMERRRGNVNYSVVDAMLAWTREHDIPLRGHCVFWGVPGRVQDWVKQLNNDDLREVLKNRAMDIGRRYRGRFAEYDLNNEMIHANYYQDRLGPGITKNMADWFKEADPEARLFVNDYDILTGNRLDDYIKHIRGLLEQGTPLGGIGVQGHLHGESFDREVLHHALNELGKIGLPIRVTEFNMPGQRSRFMRRRDLKLTEQQEQAKAKALADYYRICFAHPAVDGILMWGFWEGANWIRQSSLYRRDWTPTPAAGVYRDLVFKQWWTDWEGKTDVNGQCRTRAFYGRYAVTCGEQRRQVSLSREKGRVTVRFE